MEKQIMIKGKEIFLEEDKLITLGEKELNSKGTFFNLIDHIMNDNITRCFIDEYFKEWDDIKTSLMFIKTYQIVERQIRLYEYHNKKKFGDDDRRKMLIGMVKNLISNSESRKEIVDSMNSFMNINLKNAENICKNMVELNLED